jgi:hypothetical protein
VECALPLDELHALGRLPRAEGLRACGRLVRVPVVHEEVALSLWEFLVARGGEGEEEKEKEGEKEKEKGGEEEEEKEEEKGGQVRVVVGEVEGGGGVKRGVVGVVREVLQRGCRLWGRGEKPGKAVKAKVVGCPFCSGNCQAYHPPADTTRPPEKRRQQEGDDFWQREDLRKGQELPGARSKGRKWSLSASFRELFNE